MGSNKRKERESPGSDPRGAKKVIVTESQKFTDYYKLQNIFSSAEEYDVFQSYLVKPLPSTFRITGNKRSHATLIRDLIEKSFIPDMQDIKVDDVHYDAPSPIPWYPDRLGWQINAPRPVIRRSAPFSKFQKFIMSETEAGNLSRQEAVSMIPPMLLDVKPHQKVLDMCAAPGSKTAQIIEYLHANDKLNEIPDGLVIANDADYKRSHMLVHQSKRLQSPCFMATNHDASQFPTIHTKEEEAIGFQFDRVLCDVPCSGDGTLRKNPRIWRDWTPASGLALHNLQVQIFLRGAQLTRIGGRIVYSTCSFNPIENEAVVAEVLRLSNGALELLDVSNELVGLKRRPGLNTWNVLTKDGHKVNSVEEIKDTHHRSKFPRSVFPPKDNESFGLEKCLRVYPQDQNTGGFFIAVFSKAKSMTIADRIRNNETPSLAIEEMKKYEQEELALVKSIQLKVGLISEQEQKDTELVEQSNVNPNKPKKEVRGIKESPFVLVSSDNPDIDEVNVFYGISSSFPRDQYLLRAEDTAKNRCLYFISKAVKHVLEAPDVDQLYIVNTGVRLFVRQGGMTEIGAPFRIANEGLALLDGALSNRRRITITYDELRILLTEAFPMLEQFEKKTQDKLENIELGCCIFCVDSKTTNDDKAAATVNGLEMPVWKGKTSLNVLLNKQDKKALCQRVFQVDPEEAPEHIKEKSVSGQQKMNEE